MLAHQISGRLETLLARYKFTPVLQKIDDAFSR
jgi:hypothetical protein